MGYGIYERDGRFCGYQVPSICEHPDCDEKIDRGLAHLCGESPGGDEFGCGLYFCAKHLFLPSRDNEPGWRCTPCRAGGTPYDKKPDTREWSEWMLTHESWEQWRTENPSEVERLKEAVDA